MRFRCPKCGDWTIASKKAIALNGGRPPTCGNHNCRKKVKVKCEDGVVRTDYKYPEMESK
jgi:hypothetical protein